MQKSNILFIIPARGGSKRIPGKNIKNLGSKPLIHYTIEAAQEIAEDWNICVSTDDLSIVEVSEEKGLQVPFVRPEKIAGDLATTESVLIHAIQWYENNRNAHFQTIVLLQPTSPFRTGQHISEALELYSNDLDMVVSVKETKSNPYLVLFEEGNDGYLERSKPKFFEDKNDCPKVWEYNGAIYIINVESLKSKGMSDFNKIRKYVMNGYDSIDIDTSLDFILAQEILKLRK